MTTTNKENLDHYSLDDAASVSVDNNEISFNDSVNTEIDGLAYKDETLAHADDIMRLYDGNIIATENRMNIYDPATGTWDAKTDKTMIKFLLNDYYRQDSNASKLVPNVLKGLGYLAHQESFPQYAGGYNVLVFKNRALNPVTGEVLDFNPRHYARSKINFDYDKEATCQKWLKFLEDIFGNDADYEDKVKLLQEFMGLSLTNIVEFQQMIMLYGAGSNGKSVILKVLAELVGDGNVSHLALKDFSNRFALVKLNSKLVNIDADVDHDAMRTEGRFKSIVAGDEITVEEKHLPSFKFKPYAKLWIAANVLPKVTNNSFGYYRRINILTFNRVFDKNEQNRELVNELKSELSGILNWALIGLTRLLKNNNFTMPASSLEAIKTYECDNNSTKMFFNEKLELVNSTESPKERIKKKVLYDLFMQFVSENNFARIDSARFGKELVALGVKDGKSGSERFYYVKVRDEVNAEDTQI